MTTNELIERLESLGYLYVNVVEEVGDFVALTAVDPQGYQIEIERDGNTVVDRKRGDRFWDIMFIDGEAFL